jgi:hypothetical protein
MGRYPLGHPIILTKDFAPITSDSMPYFGVVHCDVLPPRELFHPVLPMRAGKKLTFGLCGMCMKTQQNTKCNHNDTERLVRGAYVTPELKKALDLGYRVVTVFEVLLPLNFLSLSTHSPNCSFTHSRCTIT